MPVVLRAAGYKFWFYEADLGEPPHVHVGRESRTAKFWLNPVKIARSGNFKPITLRAIERILRQNQDFFVERMGKGTTQTC